MARVLVLCATSAYRPVIWIAGEVIEQLEVRKALRMHNPVNATKRCCSAQVAAAFA